MKRLAGEKFVKKFFTFPPSNKFTPYNIQHNLVLKFN